MNLLDIGQIYLGAYDSAKQRARSQWERDRADRQDAMIESERKRDADERKRRFDAIGAARKGDYGPIGAVDPELAIKFDEIERGKAEKRSLATANIKRQIASAPDDQRRAAILDYAYRNSQGPSAIFDPLDAAGPDIAPEDVNTLGAEADAVLGPSPKEEPKTTGDITEYELAKRDPAFARYQERMRRAGASRVNVGGEGVGLTTASQTQQQGRVLDADKRLAQLDFLEASISDAGGHETIGSYAEDLKAQAKTLMSKSGFATKEDKSALRARAKAVSAIGGFTNQIISDLSGANVPPAEMERMVQSLPTVDDEASAREAKVQAWRENMLIVRKHGVDALVNGIRTGEISLPGENSSQPQETPGGGRAPSPQHLQGFTAADIQRLQQEAAAGDQAARQLLEGAQ